MLRSHPCAGTPAHRTHTASRGASAWPRVARPWPEPAGPGTEFAGHRYTARGTGSHPSSPPATGRHRPVLRPPRIPFPYRHRGGRRGRPPSPAVRRDRERGARPATGPLALRRYRVYRNAFPTSPITVFAKPVPLPRGRIPPAGVHPPFLSPRPVSVPVKRNVFPERSTLTLTTPFPAWYPSSTEPPEGRAPPTDPYRSPLRHPSRRAAPPGTRRSCPGRGAGARAPARSARAPRRPPTGTAVSPGGPDGPVSLSTRVDSRRSGPHRRAGYSAIRPHSRRGVSAGRSAEFLPVFSRSRMRSLRRARVPDTRVDPEDGNRAAAGAGGGGSGWRELPRDGHRAAAPPGGSGDSGYGPPGRAGHGSGDRGSGARERARQHRPAPLLRRPSGYRAAHRFRRSIGLRLALRTGPGRYGTRNSDHA